MDATLFYQILSNCLNIHNFVLSRHFSWSSVCILKHYVLCAHCFFFNFILTFVFFWQKLQWYPSRRELERGSGRRIEGSGLKEVVVYHFLHYILHLYIDIRYVEGSGSQFLTTSLIIFLTTSFTIFLTTSHLISFVWCPLIICLNLWKQDPFSLPQTTFSLPPSSKQILNGAWHYWNQNCNIFVSSVCKVQAIRLGWCHKGKFFLKVHFPLILSLSSGYLWLKWSTF